MDTPLHCQTETIVRTDILSQTEQLIELIKMSPAFQSFGVGMYGITLFQIEMLCVFSRFSILAYCSCSQMIFLTALCQ